jgi:microcystin-dependent protein
MAAEIKKIILRQGTESERQNVSFEPGEPGYCTDSQRLYIGTGGVAGVPVGTKNLGFATFTGNNTNIVSFLAPASGDFVFDTGTNLMYMLTGTDFARTSAFAPFGSQFNIDNNTLINVGNVVRVADNGLLASKLASASIGSGLERLASNTILKTKVGSSLTYDTGGGMIVADNSITNAKLTLAPANTIKGRLNTGGQVQDLTPSDLQILLAGLVTTNPIGTVIDWAGSGSPPATYLECNGTAISRTSYSELFTVLGTTWGAGDGSTTFNLPDLRRRVTMGAGGTGSATIGNVVGNTGGEEDHVLTESEGKCEFDVTANFRSPGSVNPITSENYIKGLTITNSNGNFTYPNDQGVVDGSATVGSAAATAHNTMQPSAVVRKLIKATS